jgi:hypothetical protein
VPSGFTIIEKCTAFLVGSMLGFVNIYLRNFSWFILFGLFVWFRLARNLD